MTPKSRIPQQLAILPDVDSTATPRTREQPSTPDRDFTSDKIEIPTAPDFVILCGDAAEVLHKLPERAAQLVVTSPPYADRRNGTYGGIPPDRYVEWFLPHGEAIYRVLRDDGTFILNIKENVVNGERHVYVHNLIAALRDMGWLWTEEFVWHKKNAFPGKWPNRFRDAWERLLQFNKQRKFVMHQDEMKIPVGDWADKRLANLSDTDRTRNESSTGSGFGRRIENWVGRTMVYPTNVLQLATECGNRGHSAAFPEALPEWFIRLFTTPGDVVIDPFAGSGTTIAVAHRLERAGIGIDIDLAFCRRAHERATAAQPGRPPSPKKPKTVPNHFSQQTTDTLKLPLMFRNRPPQRHHPEQ